MKACVLLVSVAFVFSGCSSAGGTASPLIADKTLHLTANTAVSLSTLATAAVVGAAIYMVYDPLAPNWEIEESRLNEDTYHFSLKMKRYHTGGAGESMQVLKRRASKIQYEQGFASYQILEYTEGIESQTIGARRMAEGTIKLVQRQQADSFLQN
jgi:hypothetical protein